MKVKQVPQDFVVEERARVRPTDRGPFALYLLRKEGIGTLEALRAVRRAWQVPGRAVGFGGLKDRHAVTTQWVTIPRGPRRNLEQPTFRLTYEGQFTQPMSRMLLEGNTFGIRIRDLSDREARTLSTRLADLATHGVPAYFDDQRFGSIRGDVPFAALLLLRGDAEGAFRAAVASPSREDRGPVKKRKIALARAWGHWEDALPHLHGTPTRAAVLHLVAHPDDFVGAFAALDREEKALLTSAWASSVWNRALAARVEALVAPDDRLVLPGASEPARLPEGPRRHGVVRHRRPPAPRPQRPRDRPRVAGRPRGRARRRRPPRRPARVRPAPGPRVARHATPRPLPPRRPRREAPRTRRPQPGPRPPRRPVRPAPRHLCDAAPQARHL